MASVPKAGLLRTNAPTPLPSTIEQGPLVSGDAIQAAGLIARAPNLRPLALKVGRVVGSNLQLRPSG